MGYGHCCAHMNGFKSVTLQLANISPSCIQKPFPQGTLLITCSVPLYTCTILAVNSYTPACSYVFVKDSSSEWSTQFRK